MASNHLWEHNHPYYWTEGAFFQSGYHSNHASWSDFLAEMGDSDDDLNLALRWDWDLEMTEVGGDTPMEPVGTGTLKVRYVLQRKGICMSHDVAVKPEDEAAVREWLAKRWEKVRELWAPFSAVTP